MRLALAAALFLSFPALAQTVKPVYPPREVIVTRIVDGDIFGFKMPGIWPEIEDFTVRVKWIDTPESLKRNAECEDEINRGIKATLFTRTMIMYYNNKVFLTDIEHDKYGGRIDAVVNFADGTNLGDTLIANGHARFYDGGTKQGWC